MKITIKDVAKKAQVSTTTVSKILNNKDENISNTTRERVLNIIKDLNYSPSKIAQSLVTKKTKTIGLIIPDITNPFFPELARGAEDCANERDYNLIICNTDCDLKKEKKYIDMMHEKMVDGILLVPSNCEDTINILDIKKSFVLIDRDINIDCPKVISDNFNGAYEAVTHFINLGRKKIVFLGGIQTCNNSSKRLEGYKKALLDNNINYDEKIVVMGEYKEYFGYRCITQLLCEKEYDAIFCSSDLIALGVVKALKEKNVSVPKDVSIIGFDNTYISILLDITSVYQSNYDMGYKSCDMLINIIEGIDCEKNICLESKLIVRKSSEGECNL